MKKRLFTLLILGLVFFTASAQESDEKLPVYANFSLGYGNTFFSGRLGDRETVNDERGYGRNDGFTLASFFYYAPDSWKGFGLGTGVKGFFATPNVGGPNDSEEYFFNYYHVGLGAKYHFSKTFNKGLFVKTSIGFGQMTEKTRFLEENRFEHQFAVGTTVLGGVGYSFPINSKVSFNVDLDYEFSNRRGDVTGEGQDIDFRNSHVSINFGVGF